MARTVMQVMEQAARDYGSLPALKVKQDGAWRTTTWSGYYANAKKTARGFIALGLEPGAGVSIIGYNCPRWFDADIGAIFAGAVPAGIYTTSSPEQSAYIAGHCEAQVAVVEDDEQLAKFLEVRGELPALKAIVMMRGSSAADGVYSWEEMLAKGEAEVTEEQLQERIDAQKPEDLCTLIYTSGTTGQPKAVMISHDNVTWTARQAFEAMGGRTDDQLVSYLPLSHIAEQIISLHGPMQAGCCTAFAESIEKLGDNLVEIRPTLFLGVPRVWEKIQAKIMAAAAGNTGLKKRIGAWARAKGLAGGQAQQHGQPMPMFYGLADKLVFSKVREKLGLDRCRFQVTSAAPISRDTLDFFLSLGIPLYEVYGMSECTGPATLSLPTRYRTGKAGFCLPGAELKIAEDGEVCMRGAHVFMGYYKDPEATAEALDDEGWLHSGDIGDIDSDGFLQITDRKKDLLITAGGENIAPQVIEGQLKSIPVVMQAVVVGDRRKYLAALFTLDPERIAVDASAWGSAAKTPAEAAKCEIFKKHLDLAVSKVNAGLARVQTIKRWEIIPEEFSIEGGELTPTMKIKRKVVREKHAAAIESLYS